MPCNSSIQSKKLYFQKEYPHLMQSHSFFICRKRCCMCYVCVRLLCVCMCVCVWCGGDDVIIKRSGDRALTSDLESLRSKFCSPSLLRQWIKNHDPNRILTFSRSNCAHRKATPTGVALSTSVTLKRVPFETNSKDMDHFFESWILSVFLV